MTAESSRAGEAVDADFAAALVGFVAVTAAATPASAAKSAMGCCFAAIEDLEVLAPQAGDRAALGIVHGDADLDQLGGGPEEGVGRLLRGG